MPTSPHTPLSLAQALIRCPSVTPREGGALTLLQSILEPAGFACHRMTFTDAGTPDVENLYARFGDASSNGPTLCFAGHTDVVPPGDESAWTHPPFAAEVADGMLWGRGAIDMKGAIACFTVAALDFIASRGGQCAGGLLMDRELKFLGDELENPARPFVVILGGAKVSDKILVIDRLIEKADTILIGGAMAYTFKLANGCKVGKSLVEPDKTEVARAAVAKAKTRGVQFLIPTDNMIATPVATGALNKKGKPVYENQNPRLNTARDIPDDAEGFDIGPETARTYAAIIRQAKTILWNGPMGMFEDPRFAEGTATVAKAVVDATQSHGAKSIIGGGDSVKALNQAGLGDQVTFMSTGGGASLEFLEGSVLPGVAALSDK